MLMIDGPAAISFSGGRTSAYMLWRILEAHGGKLPPDVIPIFANTGKERAQTLQFILDCETHWDIKVHWVEWRAGKPGFAEVNFTDAARHGQPFAALIAKKKITPNWQMRFCTQYLKVQAMTAYTKSLGWEPGKYKEVIGLRYDEGPRIFKMLDRNEKYGRVCSAPLAKEKVTERDVMQFWKKQSFDLDLQPGEGNCDLCFLKGRGLRKEIISKNPALADWWIDQEAFGFFDRRDSYAGLRQEAFQSPDMFYHNSEDDHDVECGLLCAPDDYDKRADFAGSLNDGYAAIRQRVADGGEPWRPK